MVNFNEDSVWNLKPIHMGAVNQDVYDLLIDGEKIEMAFQTVRDQLLFTNKRIISIDVQGITSRKKSYNSMPYSKIIYFSIQTPGLAEFIPDSELFVAFSTTFTATFEFKGNVDIYKIGRIISSHVL